MTTVVHLLVSELSAFNIFISCRFPKLPMLKYLNSLVCMVAIKNNKITQKIWMLNKHMSTKTLIITLVLLKSKTIKFHKVFDKYMYDVYI